MAIKSLASSGGDYTAATLQSGYIDTYLAGLGPFSEDEVLEINNEEFTFTGQVHFTGFDTNGRSLIIRAQSGEGPGDLIAPATGPLRYGAGARWKFTGGGYAAIRIGENGVELENFSVRHESAMYQWTIDIDSGCVLDIDRMLIEADVAFDGGGGIAGRLNAYRSLVLNEAGVAVSANGRGACLLVNCGLRGGDAAWNVVTAIAPGDEVTCYSCVLQGVTVAADGGVVNGDYNATTAASWPTGSHNLTSQTLADLIQSNSWGSHDWRAKTSGNLKDNGDPANVTATAFFGTTRDGTPYIGPHEADVAGGGGGIPIAAIAWYMRNR